jgi:hypothetical protein
MASGFGLAYRFAVARFIADVVGAATLRSGLSTGVLLASERVYVNFFSNPKEILS